jgi:hypothetical protein
VPRIQKEQHKLSFLTPELFDALVLIVIAIGLVLAAIRIYGDFKRGPRWSEESMSDIPGENHD